MPVETLITDIIHTLADDTEAIEIDFSETRHMAIYDITVSDNDLGKVIGKRGVQANALRIIFSAIYAKLGKKLYLKINDTRRDK